MRGWSDEDLMKITKGNILRVMKAAENYAASQKGISKPAEEWIPASDVAGVECRTQSTRSVGNLYVQCE